MNAVRDLKNLMTMVALFNIQLFDVDGMNRATSNEPGNDLSPGMKIYYDTELLENAREKLYFAQLGKKVGLPANGGTTIEWRGFAPFAPALKPLEEGVTPNGNKLNMRSLKAELGQYGDYSKISDKLELHHVDDVILGATEEHGAQAGETLDLVTRNNIMMGTSVMYAPDADGNQPTARHQVSGDNRFTTTLINKGATFLKKMKAPKKDGSWLCLVHPSVSEDVRESKGWVEVHQYEATREIFEGEIGELHGVRFIETNNVKVYRGADLAEDARELAVKGAINASSTITFDGGIVEDNALAERFILVGNEKYYVISNTDTTITVGDYITKEPVEVTIADKAVIYPGEGGAKGCAVYGILFLGKDAYGVVDPEGAGMEMIIKDRKQAGGPLNQWSTVGWKAETAARILYEERMLRLECGSSYSEVDEAN